MRKKKIRSKYIVGKVSVLFRRVVGRISSGNFKETCHFIPQSYGSTYGFINLQMKAEGSFRTTGSNYQPTIQNTTFLNKKTGLQLIKS
jgi:hypothetical protein